MGARHPLRVCSVPYLNALPLLSGLDGQEDVQVHAAPPSQLVELLDRRQTDVALVPVGALLGRADLVMVSDACIAARGAVDSVLLLLRRAPHKLREIVLDQNSRSSQLLTRICLRELFGVRPHCMEADPRLAWRQGRGDGVLIIGDDALSLGCEDPPALDLAQEWHRLVGLPFVFAVWAARRDVAEGSDMGARLTRSRDAGCARLGALAREAQSKSKLPPGVLQAYFTRRIQYRLGPSELAGLRRFAELAGYPAPQAV